MIRVLFLDRENNRADIESDRFFKRGSVVAFESLSSALRDKGCKVDVVYGNEPIQEEKYDVAVVQRHPGHLERVNARVRILWSHDPLFYCQRHLPAIRTLLGKDPSVKVMLLSEFHRSTWSALAEEFGNAIFLIVPHGVNSRLVNLHVGAERRRQFVYASAPHRGLHCLLDMWPSLHSKLPDFALHITTGMETYRTPMHGRCFSEVEKRIARAKQTPGIVFHHRLPAPDFYRLLSESEALLYPCIGEELYCITAHEAAACGCVPVVSSAGVFPEMIRSCGRGILVPGRPSQPLGLRARLANLGFYRRFVSRTLKAVESREFNEIRNKTFPLKEWDWSARADLFLNQLNLSLREAGLRKNGLRFEPHGEGPKSR